MPVQQITVVPAKETANNGKSAPRSKDKNEGRKAPGRSGSRSSNISKASNSTTGVTTASKTSISPSSQDICSSGPLTRLEEDASESHTHNKHTSEMTVTSTALGSSTQAQKKQVKRRHRHKKSSCSAVDCVETNGKQEQTDRSDRSHSSDRSERGEKRERSSKTRRELPPRLRCTGAQQSDSSTEDEAGREARSWSKEKARRVCRRSSRETDGANRGQEGEDKTEVMELQSMGSEEGKENQPLAEESRGLKKRHSSRGSIKTDGSPSRDKEKSYKSQSPEGSSSPAEDAEELITKRYQEKGSGGGDMSVPTPQNHCGVNGGVPRLYSVDSETEVCRICHCEGDDEFPLIMPCRCTGSLSFVHQSCLNQWIKSSDTRCCELCKFDFIMETSLKPLCKWEKLQMTTGERRKIFCSVLFHLIAIACMLWSVYILVKRTAEEIRLGKDGRLRQKSYTQGRIMESFSSEVLFATGCAGVALLDQADRCSHRLHRRPHLHVHSVQGVPAAVAPPQGLQPHHHGSELPRERPAPPAEPRRRPLQRQARNRGGPGSACTDGLRHVSGRCSGTGTQPRLTSSPLWHTRVPNHAMV